MVIVVGILVVIIVGILVVIIVGILVVIIVGILVVIIVGILVVIIVGILGNESEYRRKDYFLKSSFFLPSLNCQPLTTQPLHSHLPAN